MPPSHEIDEKSPSKVAQSDSQSGIEPRYSSNDRGQNAIKRIVLGSRNIGLGRTMKRKRKKRREKVNSELYH